jgi:hypothetical protein
MAEINVPRINSGQTNLPGVISPANTEYLIYKLTLNNPDKTIKEKIAAVKKLAALYTSLSRDERLRPTDSSAGKLQNQIIETLEKVAIDSTINGKSDDFIRLRIAAFNALCSLPHKSQRLESEINLRPLAAALVEHFTKALNFYNDNGQYQPIRIESGPASAGTKQNLKKALQIIGRYEEKFPNEFDNFVYGLDLLQKAHDSNKNNLVKNGGGGTRFTRETRDALVQELKPYAGKFKIKGTDDISVPAI